MSNVENKEEITDKQVNIKREKVMSFPEFVDIKVSTKTFIVTTNITLNIDILFDMLPITPYIVIPKKRGRKKKSFVEDPNKFIKDGSIITLEYQGKLRGVDIKKKTNKPKNGAYFRNSVTIVMIIDNKKINYKVSRNGKFQMTGCKYDEHAATCIQTFWSYIKDYKEGYSFNNNDKNISAIFIPAMRNIDFGLNFKVDREKLDGYFNNSTKYTSLFDPSFGYTGVNIKMLENKNITTLKLKKIECNGDKWSKPYFVPYSDYINMLPQKEKDKKLNKKRYNTFLVFHSGKVIMSGMEETFMKDAYYDFLNIIRDCYNIIEERLNEKIEV